MEEGSSVAHRSHGMRGNINKFKQERLKMHIRKNFFTMRAVKQWSRLPSDAVYSPSLEVLQTYWIKPEQPESRPYFNQGVGIETS